MVRELRYFLFMMIMLVIAYEVDFFFVKLILIFLVNNLFSTLKMFMFI